MKRVSANPAILLAIVRMLKRFMPTERERDLVPIARRYLRGKAGDHATLLAIYAHELGMLKIRRGWLVKRRPLRQEQRLELQRNRSNDRYLTVAARRVRKALASGAKIADGLRP